MRIIVTGLIATYPVAGVAWDYLQYVHALADLGHDVTYLEDTGQWVYAPAAQTYVADARANVAHLAAALTVGGRAVPWAFRDPQGVFHGLSEDALAARCRDADLFLNVSGACWLREAYRGHGIAAYVDTDPGYSQAKLIAADEGRADPDVRYSAAMIRSHDVFFSFAENLGTASCTIPTAGLRWHRTRQPIVLGDWPVTPPPSGGPYTTVMSWRSDLTPPVFTGRAYGAKDVELAKLLPLPGKTRATLELAIAGAPPVANLRAAGWRVVDARTVSDTLDRYREYIAGSRGELSVAKEAYVAPRSGWFSTRSASYLAMGRPVIVQDTGLATHYPLGEAILSFDDVDGAAAALATVEEDHARRCRAARELAAEAFAPPRVLGRLFADAGL